MLVVGTPPLLTDEVVEWPGPSADTAVGSAAVDPAGTTDEGPAISTPARVPGGVPRLLVMGVTVTLVPGIRAMPAARTLEDD